MLASVAKATGPAAAGIHSKRAARAAGMQSKRAATAGRRAGPGRDGQPLAAAPGQAGVLEVVAAAAAEAAVGAGSGKTLAGGAAPRAGSGHKMRSPRSGTVCLTLTMTAAATSAAAAAGGWLACGSGMWSMACRQSWQHCRRGGGRCTRCTSRRGWTLPSAKWVALPAGWACLLVQLPMHSDCGT